MDQMPLAADTVIRRKGDWLTATIGDQLVMMDAGTGRHIGLTETGARIWELLDAPRPLGELCATLAAEYDATAEEVAADVGEFLQALADQDAVAFD